MRASVSVSDNNLDAWSNALFLIDGYTDAEILELRAILDKINKEIEDLHIKNSKMDEYYAVKKNELLEKEKYIIELKRQLREISAIEVEEVKAIEKSYNIEVIDDTDRMMLQYLQEWNCDVPITRLGQGYYLFGTRKIYAKILNGKLVVRVGGGYMIITEFLEKYSEQEIQKIQRLMEKEGVSTYEEISIVRTHLQPIWDERDRKAKRKKRD